MAILDFFSRKRQTKKGTSRLKRSFLAASSSRLYSDFDNSERSADSEIKPVLRKMRARSRDLARNNEYVKCYLDLLKTNVIGENGFSLQVKAKNSVGKLDQRGNQEIEAAWFNWCRKGKCTVDAQSSFIDVQRQVIEATARDGECFIIKHRGKELTHSFGIQVLEADMLDDQKNGRLSNGNEVRMGVEVNSFKRPVAYHFLQAHPGDNEFSANGKGQKHKRVPADEVIHVFDPLRAGQSRGVPWTVSAIPALKHLGAFREAAVINARIGASKMGFFTSSGGDGYVPDDIDDEQKPIMDVEPGLFQQLPKGMDFKSFDPTYPNNEFHGFHKSVLKGVASGLGVSYTALSNDLEATSYSSIRQGALQERDTYRTMQRFMIDHFVMPVYEAWLGAAMEMGYLTLPVKTFDKFFAESTFRGRAWSWIDPVKEITAAVAGMKNGVLSIQDVATQYGKDAEELMAEIDRDKALAEQFGIKYAFEPFGANMTSVLPEIAGDQTNE